MALSDSEVETLRDNTKSLKTQGAITHALSTAEEGRLPQKQGTHTHSHTFLYYWNVNIIKQHSLIYRASCYNVGVIVVYS